MPRDSTAELMKLGLLKFNWHERAPAVAERDVFNPRIELGTGLESNLDALRLVSGNLDQTGWNEA